MGLGASFMSHKRLPFVGIFVSDYWTGIDWVRPVPRDDDLVCNQSKMGKEERSGGSLVGYPSR